MAGYFKNPDATEEAFNDEGYFKTGDIGVVDRDDFLKITGRIKDIIVNAAGKNISPQNIENSIKESRYIEQIAIIGDKRKYLSALVVPSPDEVARWGAENNISPDAKDEIIRSDRSIALIRKQIDENTTQYSRVEKIKRFSLLNDEWTQATGELTPSLKVKRRVIAGKYAGIIDDMYQD